MMKAIEASEMRRLNVLSDSQVNAASLPQERSAAFCSILLSSNGELIVAARVGSDREGADGRITIFVSPDHGATWTRRFVEGDVGELGMALHRGESRACYLSELTPGILTATVLAVDRSDEEAPFVNQETQGLLAMQGFLLESRDFGRSWSPGKKIDLAGKPGASPTGPLLDLVGNEVAQPYETWKGYWDAAPARQSACLRISPDGGQTWTDDVVIAADRAGKIYYWDQRIAVHPDSGQRLAMFWTHDVAQGRDRDVHISWGTPDGRSWTTPRPTSINGQHCTPISMGGDVLVAVYAQRSGDGGIKARISEDFGRTWDVTSTIAIYENQHIEQRGANMSRPQNDYWNDMGAWTYGHPVGARIAERKLAVVYYAGENSSMPLHCAQIELCPEAALRN